MLVLVLSVVPNAEASSDSLLVLLFIPSGTYHVGDTVTVTVRVFNLGVAANPTNLSVFVFGGSGIRNLTYTQQGAGSFASTLQIQTGDLSGYPSSAGLDTVAISANATVGGLAYSTTSVLWVDVQPLPLQLQLAAPDGWVPPGANVSVNATIRANGALADPTTLSIWAYLNSPTEGLSPQSPISMTRVGAGQYHGVYRVPAGTLQDTGLSISGKAVLGPYSVWADYVYLNVGLPHEYVVWYHIRMVTASYSLVDVLVANETAWPVEGASVSLSYPSGSCFGSGCMPPRWLSGTTDRLGIAAFNLTYATRMSPASFPIQGNVSVAGRTQTYGAWVYNPSGPTVYPTLCPTDSAVSYAPGAIVQRTYHGSCGLGGPNETYYYYAYTSTGVIANGSVTADSHGNFTIGFAAPSEDVMIILNTYINSYLGWSTYRDVVPVADPAGIQISNLDIGQVAQITVALSNSSGSVLFLPYNASHVANPWDSGWSPVSSAGIYGQALPAVPGAPFHANLTLPRFLPKDQDYLLVVGVDRGQSFATSSFAASGLAPLVAASGPASYHFGEIVHITNRPPSASAVFTTRNPTAGETVTANASSSSDPDGMVAAYQIDWGDGNSTGWTHDPEATHSYGEPGTFTVTVQVRDDTGAYNATTYAVTVDPTILGVRASTFYLVIIIVVAVAAIAAMVYLGRLRPKRPAPAPPAGPPRVHEPDDRPEGGGVPPPGGR